MKNENETVEAWIWDSGRWSDETGKYTQPRILSTMRHLGTSGLVDIKGLRYHSSAIGDSKLPQEPDTAHKLRIAHSSKVRRQRVEETSSFLGYEFEDDTNTEIFLPTAEHRRLFFVTMPACEERVCVVNQLLSVDPDARIVIAPPAFTDLNELDSLIKNDTRERVIPFLPYRYSGGMASVREHAQPIQAVLLNVISGAYPGRLSSAFTTFLTEFCLPALDCLIHLSGRVLTGTTTYTEAGMVPVIICNSIHETGIVSSATLSATGNFGDVNFTLRVLFNGATFDLTDAFKHSVLRGGPNRNKFTESGHDASGWELNGYSQLLSNTFTGSSDVPTLNGFRNTQSLVNGLFQALATLSDGEHPQQQTLTFSTGEEQK